MRLCFLTSRLPPERCGVGDYTTQLAQELSSRGHEVTIVAAAREGAPSANGKVKIHRTVPSWGLKGIASLKREMDRINPDLILLQWVPFLYSPRGMNLALSLGIAALKTKGFRIQTMVHEPWVAFERPTSFIAGPIQRLALGKIIKASQATTVSILAWTELLKRCFPKKSAHIEWVPVGNNIPVIAFTPAARHEFRRQQGIPQSAPVLCIFSLYGAAKGFSLVEAAWSQITTARADTHLVVLGASIEEGRNVIPRIADDPRCHFTGYLSEADVSRWMGCCDLFLAAFTDGISTRRTSAITAMAHGLPVIATRGRLTERALFENSPVRLTEMQAAGIAQEVLALVADPARCLGIGEQTREFFETHFSWKRIGDRILEVARSSV